MARTRIDVPHEPSQRTSQASGRGAVEQASNCGEKPPVRNRPLRQFDSRTTAFGQRKWGTHFMGGVVALSVFLTAAVALHFSRRLNRKSNRTMCDRRRSIEWWPCEGLFQM